MRLFQTMLCVALLAGLLMAGCVAPPLVAPPGAGGTAETPVVVAFEELVANASRYAGQRVCTEGVAVEGFEANALGAGIRQQGQAVYLTEPTIWIATAEKEVIGECTGADASGGFRFCPARVCGLFEAEGGYGHLGQHAYQIR
ncbi:MAG: hypothetical protein V9H69_23610 [Anaerolineae bacterium]